MTNLPPGCTLGDLTLLFKSQAIAVRSVTLIGSAVPGGRDMRARIVCAGDEAWVRCAQSSFERRLSLDGHFVEVAAHRECPERVKMLETLVNERAFNCVSDAFHESIS